MCTIESRAFIVYRNYQNRVIGSAMQLDGFFWIALVAVDDAVIDRLGDRNKDLIEALVIDVQRGFKLLKKFLDLRDLLNVARKAHLKLIFWGFHARLNIKYRLHTSWSWWYNPARQGLS